MIEFTNIPDKLTIGAIFQYTWKYVNTRFEYSDRDILPSRLVIAQRKKYRRNKEGEFNTPEELITISSWSAPQYYPYTKLKNKNYKRQMTVKHNYRIFLAIQLDSNKEYSFNSKIIWRVGSYKKPVHPPQNKVKTIYQETRDRLNYKYRKEKPIDKKKLIDRDIERIRKNSPYLNEGDYNAQVNGIMLDCYYRDYPLQNKFNCLYGPVLNRELPKGINMPFFDKHTLAVLALLMKRGILKSYK